MAEEKAAKVKEKKVVEPIPEDRGKALERLKQDREKIRKLRFDHALGQLDDPSQIRKVRREIARVLTVVNRKAAKTKEASK